MPLKIRLIVILFAILMLPFVIINLVARLLGFGPKNTFDVLLYRRKNGRLEFARIVEFPDQILEQKGVVGEKAERVFHDSSQLDMLKTRAGEWHAAGFSGMPETLVVLSAPTVEDFPSRDEMALRNALWEELDEFLADRGLGSITGASSGSGTMDLDLELIDVDLGVSAVRAFVSGTDYAGFTKFEVCDYSEDDMIQANAAPAE